MIHADTQVVISMKALIAGMGAFLVVGGGILWGVLSFSIGGVRDDVSAIRQNILSLQGADKDNVNRNRDVELKLSEQVGALRTDLATFSGKFDNVANKLDAMSGSLNGLTGRLDKFESTMFAAQASWNDPKRVLLLADALKKAGIDEQKIVIVPLPPAP